MSAGVVLTAGELDTMAGLPHVAFQLYVCLRRRMDYRTAIVGAPRAVSWQALVEDLYIEPGRGEMPGGGPWRSPGREAVRRIMAWLVRAELVQLRSNAQQAQLLFYLPKARTLSLVQKKPDQYPTGKPDRAHRATLSTETRPTAKAETRQTSVDRFNGNAAAAATVASLIDARELVFWAPHNSPHQVRAFGAIFTKHQLTRDQAQLLLDELKDKSQSKGAIRNGPALLAQMARQLVEGDFYGTHADRARGGGSGLSAEEARFINEGGSNHERE